MNRLSVSLLLLATACAPTLGDPRPVALPTVALRAEAATDPATAAAALRAANPRVALLIGPPDAAWFEAVATASGLTAVSGPGLVDEDMGLAFLGLDAVGDTTVELTYDGGGFLVHDALYDLGERRWLDLLSFRVEDPGHARARVTALTRYVATDVEPGAAVVMAVAVPSAAVGDSVARLLAPMYESAVRCDVPEPAMAASTVRLFYGPAARIYCRDAAATITEAGSLVRADLVVGRRR
jgi:hypothetical protein